MARGKHGRQYGLKIVHKASNKIESECWFNTELERQTAMGGTKLTPGLVFQLEEKEIDKASSAKPREWGGPI
jgi:hypothetical protein